MFGGDVGSPCDVDAAAAVLVGVRGASCWPISCILVDDILALDAVVAAFREVRHEATGRGGWRRRSRCSSRGPGLREGQLAIGVVDGDVADLVAVGVDNDGCSGVKLQFSLKGSM